MRELIFVILFFAQGGSANFDPTAHPSWKLLRHDICGQVDSHRIIGGKEAPMNAYPWLVRIGYASKLKPDETLYRCGGAIANSKTIVTAAHCVENLPPRLYLKTVRLGEHDIETDPDCDGNFCADRVVDMEVLEAIIPPNYNEIPFKHDIAIIRLKQEITFTKFIKPICFLSGKLFSKNLIGSIGEVAGWGIYNIERPAASKKLQVVKLPVVSNEICVRKFPKFAQIGDTQLCVGGEVGKDSCGGDSGGPVMMVDDFSGEPRYYILGLVSFGVKRCGHSDTPGVYTRMASYMQWFLDNLDHTTLSAQVVRYN